MAPPKRAKPVTASTRSKSKLTLDSLPTVLTRAPSSTPSSFPHDAQVQRISKPLTSFARPIVLNDKGESSSGRVAPRKALVPPIATGSIPSTSNQYFEVADARPEEDQLWVDKYVPETEAELAVHKKKVEDVRRWITEAFDGGPTGALTKYRRILALTGPAGTGKTAVLQVLARELDFEIVEWRNAMDDNFTTDGDSYYRESLSEKFQSFLEYASSCRILPALSSTASSSTLPTHSRRIILLEDLPNILHPATADAFHAALEDYLDLSSSPPLVLVVSDAGTRGEDPDDMMRSRRWGKQAIDVRSVIPPSIFNTPYFTELQFNPIAPTLLVKALNSFLTRHFSSSTSFKSKSKASAQQPSKEVVQMIAESAHGDIRSAIMALQFACVVQLPKGKKKGSARIILEAVTRREQSLALFHMLGKVLYNKRKGDPPNSSASVKGREREEELDMKLPDPSDLPSHLADHARRSSRVDVNTLYADSPIDTSLFALYLHQNYTQFCNEVDECDAVCEWLSWIDASGGETWQAQQNPHQFHLLTLGVLHGLPSPVPRRSQKMFKPEFFDVLKKIRTAEDAVTDTETWLNVAIEDEMEGGRRWGQEQVVLELGGVLKALDACGISRPPSAHPLFTTLSFVHPARMSSSTQRMQQLGEAEAPGGIIDDIPGTGTTRGRKESEEHLGGWLESDDIQDF